jgi:hypothetical protein
MASCAPSRLSRSRSPKSPSAPPPVNPTSTAAAAAKERSKSSEKGKKAASGRFKGQNDKDRGLRCSLIFNRAVLSSPTYLEQFHLPARLPAPPPPLSPHSKSADSGPPDAPSSSSSSKTKLVVQAGVNLIKRFTHGYREE